MGQRTSVYLPSDLADAVKTSGIPLAELIRRGLTADAPPPPAPSGALQPGEPSPGTACTAPGCWQRNTRRYGLRRVPLCPACAAALTGQTYQRELPRGTVRGTAAQTEAEAAR